MIPSKKSVDVFTPHLHYHYTIFSLFPQFTLHLRNFMTRSMIGLRAFPRLFNYAPFPTITRQRVGLPTFPFLHRLPDSLSSQHHQPRRSSRTACWKEWQ